MEDSFLIAAITEPEIRHDEARAITRLLQSGAVDFVHLRHPSSTLTQVKQVLDHIPNPLHNRIRIHGHFELLYSYNLSGPQLNSRCPEWRNAVVESGGRWCPKLTRSCHSLDEISAPGDYFYSTLSPIYTSISKTGYKSKFKLSDLYNAINGHRVMALGGVTPFKFAELRRLGFIGAAMLGYVWEGDLEERIRKIHMMRNFGLQYITNGQTPKEVLNETLAALKGGCKWVQVRMKNATDTEVEEAVKLLKPLCAKAGAILLLDDRVELAKKLEVDGVHLGKNDMDPAEARKILGQAMIIGSTANTLEDLLEIQSKGASDYAGVGPLRFTTTKKNLAPVLGYEGYKRILSHPDISIPVVAIGSVNIADVKPLVKAGAQGVAVSGSIRNSDDPIKETQLFTTQLYSII